MLVPDVALVLAATAASDTMPVRSPPRPGAGAKRASERLSAKLALNARFYAGLTPAPISRQFQRRAVRKSVKAAFAAQRKETIRTRRQKAKA